MKSETKKCQNCKKDLLIELEDFNFYEKISSASGGKIPPPTFCPECRFARRMAWRNERALYKRKCDATGINIISICFDLGGDNTENCHYTTWSGFGAKDLFDVGPGVGWVSELVYESVDTIDTSNILGCMTIHNSNNIFYSVNCHSSGNLFGCCGVKKKNYCVLNHQYTKEQYEELVPKIIKHMNDMPYIDEEGRVYKYGEFFPIEFSPFSYNETIAQEYFPLTKIEAKEQGYKWKEREERNYQIDIKTEDIPDDIKEMNLPIPHLCPNCRHYQRLKQRNPLKLWHRQCMCEKKHSNHEGKCEVEFETSYAPDRPEIIYCERCYQQEVY
jgi:hypothetical protein